MYRTILRLLACLVVATTSARAQETDRVKGWRSDIDTLVAQIVGGHPNPWAFRTRASFLTEANALRDSVPALSDGRVLTGVMRLIASLRDGHTGVVDLGRSAAQAWFPVRFAMFADGLWVTAIAPEQAPAAGKRVISIGGKPVEQVITRWIALSQGDNIFNQRQHSAMLSNGQILEALGLTSSPHSLHFVVEGASGPTTVNLTAAKGTGSTEWEQWGEMFCPPGLKLTTAFGIEPDAYLNPDSNATLPLHMRGRKAYWWTYVPESRTVFFQLNNVVAQSRRSRLSMVEMWTQALSFADTVQGGAERFVLDLRFNSGGDGSQISAMMKPLIKRDDSVGRAGRFFVLTSGKTFSAAVGFLSELIQYMSPIIVGEPAGAGFNASGDAGHRTLPFSGIGLIVSTRYTQTAAPGTSASVISVSVPATMTGEDYFQRRDPALEAVWSEAAPYPNVVGVLRDSGGPAARRLWDRINSRYTKIPWWEPFRWSDLNSAAYELLEHGRVEDAIAGFVINTERNPLVWETWDSLGEGYLKAGRKDDARRSYEHALQLAPLNWNAAEQRRIVADLRAGKSR